MSKTQLKRGVVTLTFLLWVLGWIIWGAARQPAGNFSGFASTMLYGFAGLASASLIAAVAYRYPPRFVFIMLFIGFVPIVAVSAWLGMATPNFLASLEINSRPVPLAPQTLHLNRPKLPLYVEVRGFVVDELTLTASYSVRDNSTKITRTYQISQKPLVETGWNADQPVFIVVETDAYDYIDFPSREVIATGILYPVVPRPGERPWINPPNASLNFDQAWYGANANFLYDPERLYFLSADSPGELRFYFILFSTFTLIVVGFILWGAVTSDK